MVYGDHLVVVSVMRNGEGVCLRETPMRRTRTFEALLRRLETRADAMRTRDERPSFFVLAPPTRAWTPLSREAWPLPPYARLCVCLVPRFAPA